MKMKQSYKLIKFDRFQDISSGANGDIIVEGTDCDGFLEKIFEIGFSDYVFEVHAYGKINYSITIGEFHQKRFESDRNKHIFNSVSKIMDELSCIQGNIKNYDPDNVNIISFGSRKDKNTD